MDLHLSDKVAVVTGASKGIGPTITRALAAEGARVVAAARTVGGPLDALAADGRVRTVAVDLTTENGPARAVQEAVEAFGGLDILVNNAFPPRPEGTVQGIRPARRTRQHRQPRPGRDRPLARRPGCGRPFAAGSGHTADDVVARAAAQLVTGRFTRAEEVADLVVLLASDRATPRAPTTPSTAA
ncbi:SDR family NAD(P)-dependent oxidoreductase [Streptomyces lavendulae]|uniref:SDR family NAD(P)-dependent oxidoreductase n=1 Tax=Streptomyces lavendulae TaxID=1914 RepID=UPI003D9E77F9